MKNTLRSVQHGMTASVLAVALFVTGAAALAATDTGPADGTAAPAGETTTTSDLSIGSSMAVPVADAGFVTVTREAETLSLTSAAAEPGWRSIIEVGTGRELEVSFRSSATRHDVNLELEDGEIRVRIRTGAASDPSSSGSPSSTSTSTTSSSSTSSSSTSSTSTLPASSTTAPTSTLPNSSTSAPTSTTTPTTTLPTSSAAIRTVVVLDAGTADFVVEGGQLKIVATAANPGWGVTVERSVGREVEASWRGAGRVDLNLELEDGMVRVRIDDRSTDERTEERISVNGNSTSTTPNSTTPSTSTVPSSSSSTTVPTPTAPTSTAPTSTIAPSPSVPNRTEVVTSAGGTVTVVVSGSSVTLVSAVPAPGFRADIRNSGGDKVDVRFEGGDRESRIELEVSNGSLRSDVDDR